jgi:hypothetical protein
MITPKSPIELFWEVKTHKIDLHYNIAGPNTSEKIGMISISLPVDVPVIMLDLKKLVDFLSYGREDIRNQLLVNFFNLTVHRLITNGIYSPILPLLKLAPPYIKCIAIPRTCSIYAETTREDLYNDPQIKPQLPAFNKVSDYNDRSAEVNKILLYALGLINGS